MAGMRHAASQCIVASAVRSTRLSLSCSPRVTDVALRRGPLALRVTAASSPSLSTSPVPPCTPSRAAHIQHSTDVHKWRSPEKEEVRRQFRGGVKLGSEFIKIREQEELEKKLIEEDKFTNWRLVYAYSLGVALLLIGLNLVMVFVKPNPSPAYVPYEESTAAEGASPDHLRPER